uniref:Ovule protein n=1 Tax=Romanomermis culicivorax TaxID=13658 RepID=A0A915ICE1_ROMCU
MKLMIIIETFRNLLETKILIIYNARNPTSFSNSSLTQTHAARLLNPSLSFGSSKFGLGCKILIVEANWSLEKK